MIFATVPNSQAQTTIPAPKKIQVEDGIQLLQNSGVEVALNRATGAARFVSIDVDVSPYAKPGDIIKLRYDFGSDGCGGLSGWYVDDVETHYCDGPTDPRVAVFADGVEDYYVSQFNLSSTVKDPFLVPSISGHFPAREH